MAKAASKNVPITVTLRPDKETPGTFRFQEDKPKDGSRPLIGTIYMLKVAWPDGCPEAISVTVTPKA